MKVAINQAKLHPFYTNNAGSKEVKETDDTASDEPDGNTTNLVSSETNSEPKDTHQSFHSPQLPENQHKSKPCEVKIEVDVELCYTHQSALKSNRSMSIYQFSQQC
ncbi:unnamed protein product [Ambrosiozyma monospora]|uniref:Unnamed protein product n=1 Tax=Ambrosiozyma monospora TaxID=43982 RepID=A0ACB5UDL3_AMBMO|nr:unnamed protein product [Ambrosiozyma monospora]